MSLHGEYLEDGSGRLRDSYLHPEILPGPGDEAGRGGRGRGEVLDVLHHRRPNRSRGCSLTSGTGGRLREEVVEALLHVLLLFLTQLRILIIIYSNVRC